MTRETREAERAKQRRVYRKAMVRVRFPDGVVLQATFSAGAPVSAVLGWVAESLSTPAAFELAMAGMGPLSELSLSLEQAELCPAALLNFRVHAQVCTSYVCASLPPRLPASPPPRLPASPPPCHPYFLLASP